MSERFDKAAKNWDEKPRRVKLAKNICAAIKERVKIDRNSRITDFGTGTGLILLGLSDVAGSLTGVDFSKGMLDVLREKAKTAGIEINTREFDIEKDDFEPEGADIITASMVAHHLQNPEKLFNKAYKGLSNGGYLCVSDLCEEGGDFHDNHSEVHHHGFSLALVREFFEKAGFKDVVIENAAEIEKERGGVVTAYPVFLATGVK